MWYEGPFVPVILFMRVVIVDLLKITNTGLCPTLCTVLGARGGAVG